MTERAPTHASHQEPISPGDAIAGVALGAPTRGNRKLEALIGAANADQRLRAWWHMQQVFATRLGMSDHSWVHVRIVLNIALRLFRLLVKRGVQPAMVRDHLMREHDAEVVIAAGCLFHDTACRSTAATTRPSACSWPPSACRTCWRASTTSRTARWSPQRRCTQSSGTAAAVTRSPPRPVEIRAGEEKAVTIEIAMNNSSGIFQVDELLATKLHGSGLEEHVEVIARIDAEHEKRLLPVFRI